ncbi:MAG: DivIVA domain-containing protein [Selenomonadaceae bacterium]|nr:DivIVA domain-containing protein [Selenomonadaceae bacterium]
MLTPMEIHDHEFKKSFRGYSENEVDDFLDIVVRDFEQLLRDKEQLQQMLKTNDKELAHYRSLEKTLNETLMVAQRTSDEIIGAAKKNAEELRENAKTECKNMRDKAEHEAKQMLDSANAKRDAVLQEYDKFVRDKNAFLMKLRTILESELSITVQMLEDVPHVDEFVGAAPVDEKTTEPKVEPVEKNPVEEKTVEPAVKPVAAEMSLPEILKSKLEKSVAAAYNKKVTDENKSTVVEKSEEVTDNTKTYPPVNPVYQLKENSK